MYRGSLSVLMYYKLTKPLDDFAPGTVFKRISTYGEDHIEACKLEPIGGRGLPPKRLRPTEKELEELFVETDAPVA